MTESRKRPEQAHFDVLYYKSDGAIAKTDKVHRAPFRGKPGLKDVQILQEALIKEFVEFNGAIGSLLAHDKVWDLICQLGAILPIVGRDKPGIDVEALAEADDLPQLARIFFSESFDDKGERETDETGAVVLAKPSLIAKLHGLDFYGPLFRLSDEKRNRERLQALEPMMQNGKPEELPQDLQVTTK